MALAKFNLPQFCEVCYLTLPAVNIGSYIDQYNIII